MLSEPSRADHARAAHEMIRHRLASLLPSTARIEHHGWRPWASASFDGARHWFDIAADQAGLSAMATRPWNDCEWQLASSFVADAAIELDEPKPGRCRLELLTVND